MRRIGRGLRRLGGLLGAGVVIALGCGPGSASGGGDTGSTSAGSDGGSSSASGSGASGSGTGPTDPDCGVVKLEDVAQGVGGFVLDGESERDYSGLSVSGAGVVPGRADFLHDWKKRL